MFRKNLILLKLCMAIIVLSSISAFAQNGLIAEFWNNVDYTGDPVFTKVDSVLQFDFGAGSVDPLVNADGVGMQWKGKLVPDFSENYTLTLFHNDGGRLWLNGDLLIDQWGPGQATHTATIDLVAGQFYDLVVQIEEIDNTTRGSLSWSSASVADEIIPNQNLFTGHGLLAEFWNNVDYTGDPVFTKVDSVLQFDFGSGSVDPLVNADGVGMQWTGQLVPDFSENYTLTLFHNDGGKLWLDGDLLIDQWGPGQATHTATIDLVAGQAYDLVVQIEEIDNTTRGSLSWSSASVAEEIIPTQNLFLSSGGAETPDVTFLTDWVFGGHNPAVTGSNRLFVVLLGSEFDGVDMTSSVKYGGQDMTLQTESQFSTGFRTYSAIYTLDEAGIAAASDDSVDVTWNVTFGNPPAIYSVMLENVDQTTPVSL